MHPPDWPNLPNYTDHTPEQHAAHRSTRGIQRAEDVGLDSRKAAKQIVKIVRKPHLNQKVRKPTRRPKKRP